MNKSYECDEWDGLTLALVKASVGNTTSNFRSIVLDNIADKWMLRFQLFADSDDDRDVINDIGTEFFSYAEDFGMNIELSDILPDEISIGEDRLVGYHPRATVVLAIFNPD